MMLPISEGQRLGNYRLHRLLGKGSFADVYLGEHLYLHTSAAIKILQRMLDEEEEQLFLAEAQTIAGLAHPHILRVREFAIERSISFLVMDYAPGGTLRRRYPKGTCLSLQETVSTIKQIASALQYAHNHGLIHRDVKPENILQGAEQVLLSDFGISITATPPSNTATSGVWAGTLPYMAPEQMQGQAVFASDQYSLAILAYEWLCGERPFEGSATALPYQHAHVPPPRLREKDPSLPEAVETVIDKALSKQPQQRYVSVLTFARALERAYRGEESYTISADSETQYAEESHLSHTTSTWRIFLSCPVSDDITGLREDLILRNLAVYHQETPASQDNTSSSQEERMRQAIRAAQAVLLVLTPRTRTAAEVHEHLRIAQLYRRRILCLWREGGALQELLPAGAEQATLLDGRAERYQVALDELIRAIERDQRTTHASTASPFPDLDFEPRNPYKGLRAFTRADRTDFFGRHLLVQDLLARLKEQLAGSGSDARAAARFLAVIGPSGSGKSSVVMAGLLPALQDGALPGSTGWIYLDPLVPGPQPLEALTQLLAARFPEHKAQAIRELLGRPGGFGLHQLGLSLMSQPQMRIVVTIDQFEELFSSDISEPDRLHFLEMLVRATTEPAGPVLVLLTLRADFYDRPFAYPEAGRLIQQQQCAVLPMSLDELREVIERPAGLADVRLTFDEDLVGDLLFDLHGQTAALPLLEFALEQLFRHRRGHRLTRTVYQEIGGVRGALSQHAEATYTALPSEEHRRLARMLFLRLVQPGEGGQDPLRRRAQTSEFDLAQAQQSQALQQVINAFLAARLITSSYRLGTTVLEIGHEALLREWQRLALWVREAREDMQLQQTISHDVREWERRGKPKDRLYRGSQLKESLGWQECNTTSNTETAFLRASTRRRTRMRINLLLAVLLLLSILIPTGVLFEQQVAPLTVTTLKDDGAGSLRQAIANTHSGGTILIDTHLKGTLILSQELVINKDLNIRGPGVNQLVIRGPRDDNSLIMILPHTIVTLSQVTFSELKPSHGTSLILNEGTLTLDGCHITGNIEQGINTPSGNGGAGGAISNDNGTLILRDSIVSHNTVTAVVGLGGGIASLNGTLIITNSQIVDNAVNATGKSAAGGAIFSSNSRITLINSTIARNRVTGASELNNGGGIYSIGGTITMTNSAITGNDVTAGKQASKQARTAGGGIWGTGFTITIANSAITGNSVTTGQGNGYGGGIELVDSTMSITGSQLRGNTVMSQAVAGGGAINATYNVPAKNSPLIGSTISLNRSVISDNTVTGNNTAQGGGISVFKSKLTLTGTTVSHNMLKSLQQVAAGGGIFSSGTLALTDGVISENSVNAATPNTQYAALGGGLDIAGILNLNRSTIAFNTANNSQGTAAGGGLYADQALIPDARISLTNCTIADNKVLGANGTGGGITTYITPISSSIDFCTISGNTASTAGGGIDWGNTPGTANLLLKNSLIAGNAAGTTPDIAGNFTTGGYNLVQQQTGAMVHDAHSLHSTDLSVKPSDPLGIATQLRMNGGPTPTLALQAGSPAIDAIPISVCDVSTDQRGVKRPQHTACDIGAYEYS